MAVAVVARYLASPHFGTWLKGQVLPSLEDRVRLHLVPLEDWPRLGEGLVADGEPLGFATRQP
jgi:hypothetical protein